MNEIHFYLLMIYHKVRLFIAKKSPYLAKFSLIYYVFQIFFRIPKLKNFLKYIENKSESDIVKNFENNEKLCFEILLRFRNVKNLYILFPFPSIGEYALSFILLRDFLNSYNGNIYIVCPENTLDIAKIFGKFFDIKECFTIPTRINYCNNKNIEKYIKLRYAINSPLNMGDLLYHIGFSHEIPLKTGENSDYFWGFDHFAKVYSIESCVDSKMLKNFGYTYPNLNLKKIDEVLKYLNKDYLIICNFESKSLRSCIDDEIKFSAYIRKISEIAKRQNLKFVINSVYNNEKLYNDENILITRLNFQEIIRLAEHNKIKLFISERNGLNDLFKVFYPKIRQCIIYPDYYWGNVSKILFKKHLNKQYDLKSIYSLKGDNVIEMVRSQYYEEIELFISNNI